MFVLILFNICPFFSFNVHSRIDLLISRQFAFPCSPISSASEQEYFLAPSKGDWVTRRPYRSGKAQESLYINYLICGLSSFWARHTYLFLSFRILTFSINYPHTYRSLFVLASLSFIIVSYSTGYSIGDHYLLSNKPSCVQLLTWQILSSTLRHHKREVSGFSNSRSDLALSALTMRFSRCRSFTRSYKDVKGGTTAHGRLKEIRTTG